jgi:hydrogenase-4 component E
VFLAHLNSWQASIFSSLAIVSLLLAFVMLGSHWLRNYVYAFAAQSWLIAALSAAVGYFGGYRELYAIAVLTALFRGLVLPWLLMRIIDRLHVKRELHAVLQPSSSLVVGALLVMFAFVIANYMNHEPATAGHVVVLALTIMISMKFLGFLMLSMRMQRGDRFKLITGSASRVSFALRRARTKR